MLSQRIMWTLLPVPEAAATGPTVRFSVLVSPRLRTDEQLPRPALRQFADFVDWPATLQGIAWVVHLDGATHVARPVSTTDSALWTEFFADSTFVRPETFTDLTMETVHSYPAGHVTSFLLDRYATVAATSPTDFPPVDWLRGPDGLGPVTFDPATVAEAAETVQAQLAAHQAVPPGPADPSVDFYQLRRFLQPRGQALLDDIEPLDPDFHEIVAMTADHPALQRRLGLVIDLELPRSALPQPGGKPRLRLEPQWNPQTADSADQTPTLICVMEDGVLRPLDDGSLVSTGRLLLAKDELFQVIQIDHDGAAINAIGLAGNLATAAQQPTVAQPDRYALPALRSAGLAIAQRGRATGLVDELARGRDLYLEAEAGNPVELTAGDVLRGFRVDVLHTEAGRWFPLHAREAVYRLPSGNGLKPTEEGTLIPSPTSAADGSAGDLFHQETLFHWMGWSLAVRRPGTAIGVDETVQADPASAPHPAYPMDVRMQVPPGSLPRLRFGSRYRFRLRAVDVAGNSLQFTPDAKENPDFVTTEVTYGRYEPAPTPRIVARRPMTLNEDVDRLVIRSNFDTPATGDSQRHVLPTAAAQLLAEQHGRFDTPGPHSEVDRAVWTDITEIEGRTLEELASARTDPDRPGETYHDVAALPVPYLPDPLTRGAAFTGLPGGGLVKVDFAGLPGAPWYRPRSCRVVLREGPAPSAVFDAATRELLVTLPKGTVVTTRLSSYLTEADLPQLGIWHLLQDHPGADLDGLKATVVDGRHWMITPHRPLTFVHAVRQPVIPPRFGTLDPVRGPGDTWAGYQAPTQLHRSSTARVDVLAAWTEIVDGGPGAADPDTVQYRATAFTHPVTETGNAQADVVGGRHELGDTRHRRIAYTAVATSRFVAYFARRITLALTGTTPRVLDAAGLVDGSVTVSIAGGRYQPGRDYTVDLDAGTIARTEPSGIPAGEQLTVQYTALPVTREAEEPAIRDVPATARPPAPAVRYAVPAFAWSRTRNAGLTVSRRTGSTLRVYLDRPWYASGDGELLGVVLERNPGTPKPPSTRDRLDNLTTLLGEDPVYRTGGTLSAALSAANFPAVVATGTDLPLPGSPERVDVAGHPVTFDTGRGLWVCDIPIAPGPGYAPLVRPALVRYQPDSLAGLHLSPVVLLDFLPLLPDREVRVSPGAGTTYTVTVTGPGYLSTDAGAQPSRITVTAERQDPRLPGEIGWSGASAAVELVATAPAQPGGPTVWSGQLELPPEAAPDPTGWRLLVEEFERLSSAATDDTPAVAERLAFLDTIPLGG